MKLAKGETVVTAWAESFAGPGWGNRPVWVLVRAADEKLHMDCIQPSEQTRDMAVLYGVSQTVHGAMAKAVREWLAAESPKKKGKDRP